MPACKQKIHVSPDQIFNYLSDLQNVVDLYKDQYSITTVKDLGSACYGKKYRYEVANKHGTSLRKESFTVEIIEYVPVETIVWSVVFDVKKQVNRNTTYIPTTVILNCTLKPKKDYTLALLDVDFEMQTSWWVKLLFKTMIRIFQRKICHVLVDVRKDIEFKNV